MPKMYDTGVFQNQGKNYLSIHTSKIQEHKEK